MSNKSETCIREKNVRVLLLYFSSGAVFKHPVVVIPCSVREDNHLTGTVKQGGYWGL